MSPSLWISVPRIAPYPPGCTSSHLSAPSISADFFFLWDATARIIKMWVILAVPFIPSYSRNFLTLTNILLTSTECWTDFFREIPSDSKITPERPQLIWNHFYVFTILKDFPHVQHFIFIWSGRVFTIHFVKKYSESCSTCISNSQFFRFISCKLLTFSLVNSDKRIY